MGTAGGEPRVLLNALKPMLGVVGDIKTPQEVMRVVGMMKDAEVGSIILSVEKLIVGLKNSLTRLIITIKNKGFENFSLQKFWSEVKNLVIFGRLLFNR